MAQRINITLIDDVDGTESETVQTVTFGFEGIDYTIDLSEANRERLSAALEPFIMHGSRVGGRARRERLNPANNLAPGEASRIREWCHKTGRAVSDRGRISADIIAEYRKSNPTS